MDKRYEISLTKSFKKSVDQLKLSDQEVRRLLDSVSKNPQIGYSISNCESSVRVFEFTSEKKKNLRFFYIFVDELSLVECVFIVENDSPRKNKAEDLILFARIIEIVLRILAGG